MIKDGELVEKTLKIIKDRKGVDHIALMILIEIATDEVGAKALLDKETNKLVMSMIDKSRANDARFNYWLKEKSKENKAMVRKLLSTVFINATFFFILMLSIFTFN